MGYIQQATVVELEGTTSREIVVTSKPPTGVMLINVFFGGEISPFFNKKIGKMLFSCVNLTNLAHLKKIAKISILRKKESKH
jgi:hypothetical protein